jgi:quinoprotein glucose dehydrogenase
MVWERPLGTTANKGPFNLPFNAPLPTGIFNMGGTIITGGGLIFVSATEDDTFRAFDERTGKILWEASLPAGGNATPSTYTGSDGRQYVVIAAGGHGGLRTPSGDYVIAYALSSGK